MLGIKQANVRNLSVSMTKYPFYSLHTWTPLFANMSVFLPNAEFTSSLYAILPL